MATLRGRPGLAGRPNNSPVVRPFSPLTASPLATRSPFVVSAKRGLVRALEAAEDEPAILVTGPTCAEGTNARATQDVPKMANPEIADESFILSLVLSDSGKGWAPAKLDWLDGYRVSVPSAVVLCSIHRLIWSFKSARASASGQKRTRNLRLDHANLAPQVHSEHETIY